MSDDLCVDVPSGLPTDRETLILALQDENFQLRVCFFVHFAMSCSD